MIKGIPMNYGFEEEEDVSKNENPFNDPSTHPSADSIESCDYGIGITEFPDIMNLSLN